MDKDIGVGPLGSVVACCLFSVLFTVTAACGDDEGSDATVGASEDGELTTSGPGSTGSTGPGSSTGPEGSTGPEASSGGTTSPADDTSTSSGSSEETAIPEVFFPEVLAIFEAECFCHRSPMPSGMLDLNDDMAYDSLVGVPSVQVPEVNLVTPGDPGNSYLYLKLIGEQTSVGGGGTRMPQGGGMLPEDQIDLVRYWILGGAQP
jgi:hypothetical protein